MERYLREAQIMADARARRQARAQQNQLDKYLEAQRQAQAAQQAQAQQQDSDAGFFERVGETIGDVALDIGYGLLDGIEGIADLGIGLVGAVGGIFDDDFKETMKEAIEYDASYEWVEKHGPDFSESYLSDDSLVKQIARSVGGMLPSIAVSMIPGAGPGVALGTLGVSAAGSGTQEAYQDGADFYKGLGYGLASGGVEMASEALLGGVTSKVFGGGLINPGNAVAKTGAKRIFKGMAEEAAEEVFASAVNPLAKTIYKGSEALGEYATPEFYKGLAESAIAGAGAAGAIGAFTGDFSKKRDVAASMEAATELRNKRAELFNEDTLTEEADTNIRESVEANLAKVENILKKMSAERRAKLIKEARLENLFEENGSMRENAASALLGEQVHTEGQEGAQSVFGASGQRYASPALWNQQQRVSEELAQITEDLRAQKNNPEIADVKVYQGELSDTERPAFKQIKKAVAALSKRTATGLNFVITEASPDYSGVLPGKSNTVYITKDTLENGTWAKSLVHEIMHYNEGTREYNKLLSVLTSDAKSFEKTVAALTQEGNPYGFGAELYDSMIEKLESGTELTEDEQSLRNELGARLAEELLGNERFIERVAQKDASLARRILAKIRDLLEAFRTLGNKEARAEYKRLRSAEKLYMNAIESSGYNRLADEITEEIVKRGEEREESMKSSNTDGRFGMGELTQDEGQFSLAADDSEVDNDAEKEYNYNKYQYDHFGWARVVKAISKNELDDLYSKVQEKKSLKDFNQSSKGEAIVEVNNKPNTTLDVNNVFVFLKGTKKKFTISRVIRFDAKTEMEMEIYKEDIYEGRKIDNTYIAIYQEEGIAREYRRENSQTFAEYRKRVAERKTRGETDRDHRGREQHRRRYSLDSKTNGKSKFSLKRDIQPVTDEEYSKLEKHFGVTGYFKVAGYLLPNGKMLDFSGKHWGDDTSKTRQVDHRDVQEVLNRGNNGIDDMVDMIGSGSVRLMPETGGINLAVYPTEKQRRVLSLYIQRMLATEGEVVIDYDDVGGDTVYSKVYGKYSSPSQILRDIKNFFNGVKQSDLMQFHSQFSLKPEDQQETTVSIDRTIRPKDPDTAYIVEGWGEDADTDTEQAQKPAKKTTEAERKAAIAEAEELERYRDLNYAETAQSRVDVDQLKAERIANEIAQKNKENLKKPAGRVNVSEGTKKKQDAVRNNDKVFSQKDVRNALWEIPLFKHLPIDIRRNLADQLWITVNTTFGTDKRNQKLSDLRAGVVELFKETALSQADLDRIKKLNKTAYKIKKGQIKTFDNKQALKAVEDEILSVTKRGEGKFFEQLDKKTVEAESEKLFAELNRAFAKIEESGTLTDKGKEKNIIKEIRKKADEKVRKERQEARETEARNKEMNRVIYQLEKARDLKKGTYHNHAEFKEDKFEKSIGQLGGLLMQRTLKQRQARTVAKALLEWYTPDNKLLEPSDPNSTGFENAHAFQEDIRQKIESIANGEGFFTSQELRTFAQVVGYFNHFVESFDKVYKNGKYVEARAIAEAYVEKLKAAKKKRFLGLSRWFESGYAKTFSDPISLMKYADKYDPHGFFTETFRELEKAAVGAAVTEMELMEKYNQFFKDHKGYEKRLEKGTVDYNNIKINVDAAICLYMTSKVDDAWKGLVKSGATLFVDGKSQELAKLLKADGEITDAEIETLVEEMRSKLRNSFTKEDLAFIETMEKILNKDCSKLKVDTDMLRLGYSNVMEKYYFPLMRADVARTVDQESFFDGVNRVSNLSMNKDRTKGASGRLGILRATEVLQRHIRQIAMYSNLAIPIDNYNRLVNLNTGDNAGAPDSVASNLKGGDKDFYAQARGYLKDLIDDMQGRPSRSDTRWYNGTLSKIRGGYAKFQLGANTKTWLTQLSSFIAATNVLDYSSIVKGMAIKGKFDEVDKYCKLAQHRNSENTVVKAQGVIDKTGKVGDVLMTPIGWVDRVVVVELFGACQVQVEADGGAKIGTEENKIAAGELLERVILETQQNSVLTGKSAAMRSGDELLKSLTMFSSDSMKVFGRFMDAQGERLAIKYELKNNKDLTAEERKALEARLKAANKQIGKSTTALVASAVFMAMLGLLFRTIRRRNKDKDAEEIAWETAFDGVGNMMGGLPIIRDIYSYFSDGYELDTFALSTLNDTLESVKATVGIATKAASGTPVSKQEVATSIRKVIYSAGQMLGIPTRNLFNTASSITGMISNSGGYYIDDLFYKQPYKADLKKAFEDGDERMIATITGLMIDEDVSTENAAVRGSVKTLIEKGYSVLPKTVGDTITHDGEEIELSASERKQFEKIYSAADQAVEKLVGLSQFKKADEEAQAKAMRLIWDTYYNLARDEVLGIETETKNVLFAQAIDIEKLAMIASVARSIKADKDRTGKEISGSRKKKITEYIESLRLSAAEKYMIMGYLGYSNMHGESQVNSYIGNLDLSNEEKKKLLEYSGYKKEA